MRSHRDIIQSVGVQRFHDDLSLTGKENTVRAWVQRDSIPAEYWPRIVAASFATLTELAAAAERRKFPARARGLAPA